MSDEQPPPDSDPVSPDPAPASPAETSPAPAGSTPGSEQLVPDPVDGQIPQADPMLCPTCGHPLTAHTAGRCTIMLGAYGTEGPCPCPNMPASVAPVDLPQQR